MKKLTKIIFLISLLFGKYLRGIEDETIKKQVVLPRINIEKIKASEIEFKKQLNNKNLIKNTLIAAGGIAITIYLTKEFISRKKIDQKALISDPKQTTHNAESLIHPPKMEIYKDYFINSLLISGIGSICAIERNLISKSFDDIKNWWQTKTNKEAFYLNESIKNLKSLIYFLTGIHELKNNANYKEFYLKQIEKTYILFVNSMENLIAATLVNNNDINIKENLLSPNNGLLIEIDSLAKNLEENIYKPVQINLNEQAIQNFTENIVLCLKRFRRDFDDKEH